MNFFWRGRMDRARPHLFEGSHWEVDAVRDLGVFFVHLVKLLPGGSVLCLAGAHWSREGRRFLRAHAIPDACAPPLPAEFQKAPQVPIDEHRMVLLADLASRHAEPELAEHIGAFARDNAFLEWYDVPDDPIVISLAVAEENVAAFARGCSVAYRQRPESKRP